MTNLINLINLMNQTKHFQNLFAYEAWANKEIAECLVNLDKLPEKGLSLMSHIIDANILWLCRIKNIVSVIAVWKSYPKSEILFELEKSSSDLIDYVSKISESSLEEIINYKNTKGESFNSSLIDILTHLAIHSAYHRGQIIILIKPFVTDLPYTDFIHYMRTIK